MKLITMSKFFVSCVLVGSYAYINAENISKSNTRGILDLFYDKKNEASLQVLTPENSLIIEDLDKSDVRCNNWNEWNNCPKRRIKAHEICAKEMYTKKLHAHHAKIKELCAHKAKINKLWSDLIVTDLLFSDKEIVDKLWADKACAYVLCAQKAHIHTILSDLIYTDSLRAEFADLEKIAADEIYSDELEVNRAKLHNACIENLNIGSLQVMGQTNLNQKYRAYCYLSTKSTYTLNNDILFDTVADDPNGNITQDYSGDGYTSYTIPESGYYIISFGCSSTNLRGGNPIAGTPINHPGIYVNGVLKTQTHLAFLAFADAQDNLLTYIDRYVKGDVLTARFKLRYVSSILGETSYNGTVDLTGAVNPSEHLTFFAIHYLSSDSVAPVTPCSFELNDFSIEKPIIPTCCPPCPIQKPSCEVDCGDCGPCGDHDNDGGCHNCGCDRNNGQDEDGGFDCSCEQPE